jgi:hypothetical protein
MPFCGAAIGDDPPRRLLLFSVSLPLSRRLRGLLSPPRFLRTFSIHHEHFYLD